MSLRKNIRTTILAALALAGTVSAGAAEAGSDVYWSIGINAPIHHGGAIGTVISNAPVYSAPRAVYGAPVYGPPPVIYRRAPVYDPPVVYAPAPVYVSPRPRWAPPRHGHHHRGRAWDRERDHYDGSYYGRDHDHDRRDGRRDGRR